MIRNIELSDQPRSLEYMQTLTPAPAATAVTQPVTDEAVIQRILLGEVQLFELLMRRYNQRLYRTARSFNIPDADCEDILQQSYLNAYENLRRFRGESKFSTWLTRIVINQCLMHKRKYQPVMDELTEYDAERRFVSTEDNPQKALAANEMRALLESAIEKLPEEYRSVYVMREVEELSVKETADCLGLSEANVKVRLHRARHLLRSQLEKYFKLKDVLEFGNWRCDRLVTNVLAKIKNVPL